jgi:hypothetical protein
VPISYCLAEYCRLVDCFFVFVNRQTRDHGLNGVEFSNEPDSIRDLLFGSNRMGFGPPMTLWNPHTRTRNRGKKYHP